MSFKAKKDFIYQNQTLPAEELASKTGLNLRQVQKLLEKIKVEKQIAGRFNNGIGKKTRIHWAIVWAPIFLTFMAYLPSLSNGFVNWDDPDNILNNIHIRSLDFTSLKWMFTSFFQGFWFPLNLFSLALDYRIGGLDPRIYHIHNLILHCLNTFFFFYVCKRVLESVQKRNDFQNRITPNNWVTDSSFFAALLFGLHPLHVETVAWVTDRKDILCGTYYLVALLVYLDYASCLKKWKLYVSLWFFVFALMAKPMAITLPLTFILLDIWPLGRFGKDVKKQDAQLETVQTNGFRIVMEKIPFFIVAGLVSWLTLLGESQIGAMLSIQKLPLIYRVANSFHTIFFQLWKMLCPINLSALYPMVLNTEIFTVENIVLFFLFVFVSGFCFYNRHKWPFFGIGWLSYLITLAPVSGLLQTGGQITADRYTYLTCLGPFLLLASGIGTLGSKRKWMMVLFSAVLTLLLGLATILQTQTWKDSIALWENVVKIFPRASDVAYSNLALVYEDAGREEDAISASDQALAINPQSAHNHEEKGVLLFHKGLAKEAIQEFHNTIALDPRQASPHMNLGKVYFQTGRLDDAKIEFETAISLDPGSADGFDSLGGIYIQQGHTDQALDAVSTAYNLEPSNIKYVLDLAAIYQKLNKIDDSIELFKRGINLNPRESFYYLDLGIAYYLKDMYPDAVDMLKKASELQPRNPDILRKLASAYLKLGQTDLANDSIQKAAALEAMRR